MRKWISGFVMGAVLLGVLASGWANDMAAGLTVSTAQPVAGSNVTGKSVFARLNADGTPVAPSYAPAPVCNEVLILAATDGGTALSAVDGGFMAGRHRIKAQSMAANAMCCTYDGTVPVISGTNCSRGEKIAADSTAPWDEALGPYPVRCIAMTASQTSGAATWTCEFP